MEVPQSTRADAKTKTKGCSLQTDSGNPLLRTTPIQQIDRGNVELVPTWSLQPYVIVSLVTKTEMWISTQPQNLDL